MFFLPETSKNFILQRQNLILRQIYFIRTLLAPYINYILLNKYNFEIHLKHKNFDKISNIFRLHWLFRYQTIVDLAAVDYPNLKYRFKITYILQSYKYTQKIFLSRNVHETKGIQSLTNFFAGTSWQEREVWDFFGIFFFGHKNLRRILTDYGFVGHPLRKDFPLTGFSELGYDDRKKQVNYHPVSLAQEFRNFRSVNPWLSMSTSTTIFSKFKNK